MFAWLRYLCTFALLPWVLVDGRHLRQRIAPLDEAPGQRSGVIGQAPMRHHVFGLGESPIAAVGLEDQRQSVTAVVASLLSEDDDSGASWTALGQSGICLAQWLSKFRDQMPPRSDLIVVSIGVNDCKEGTSMGAWSRHLGRLLDLLRSRYPQALIICSALPPLGSFVSLTWPVRVFLGARATLMNQALRKQVKRRHGVRLLAMPEALPADSFAADGFHPNEIAHQRWALALHAIYRDADVAQSANRR